MTKIERDLKSLKAYAQKNYEKGMDTYVECYSDEDWNHLLQRFSYKVGVAKAHMRDMASIRREGLANAAIEGDDGMAIDERKKEIRLDRDTTNQRLATMIARPDTSTPQGERAMLRDRHFNRRYKDRD